MKSTAMAVLGLGLVFNATNASADSARDAILSALAADARQADASFTSFSADRGQAFFEASHAGGKPDTPSCTTCHGNDPTQSGRTRAGKDIEPMAVSVTPSRFTDPAKVEKWLLRNCNTVLGRPCTPIEKGDVLAYLSSK